MLKLFYFFRGYLWIRVSGASAERFINLCGIRHIMLWNIRQNKTVTTRRKTGKNHLFFTPDIRKGSPILFRTATLVDVLRTISFISKKLFRLMHMV